MNYRTILLIYTNIQYAQFSIRHWANLCACLFNAYYNLTIFQMRAYNLNSLSNLPKWTCYYITKWVIKIVLLVNQCSWIWLCNVEVRIQLQDRSSSHKCFLCKGRSDSPKVCDSARENCCGKHYGSLHMCMLWFSF